MTDTTNEDLEIFNTLAAGGDADYVKDRNDSLGAFMTSFKRLAARLRGGDKVPAEEQLPIWVAAVIKAYFELPTRKFVELTTLIKRAIETNMLDGIGPTPDIRSSIGSGDDSTGGDTPAPTPKTVRNKQAYDLLDKLLEDDDTREGTIALLRRLGESGHKDSVKLAKSLTDLGWLESEVKMRDMFTKDQLDKAVKEEVAKRLSNDDTIKAAKAEVVDELKPQIATIYATLNQDGTSKGVKFFSKEGFFYPMAAMTKMSKAIEALRKRVGIPDLPDDDA